MSFLSEPSTSPGQQELYREDLEQDGFVWDISRLWGHQPDLWKQLFETVDVAADAAGLSARDKAVLVLGMSSTLGDSYCSMAWARNLTNWADADTARAVLEHDDGPLTGRERALAAWVRKVAADPNATTPGDLEALRGDGFSDPEILALTLYSALRLCFSTTNDALGARPDVALADMLDPSIRSVITWGRQPA